MNRFSRLIYKIRMRSAAKHTGEGTVQLLAYDGKKPNQRFGWLGTIVHGTSKEKCRLAVSAIHKMQEPAMQYKLEKGFIKPHIVQFREDWDWAMNLYEHPINKKIGGFQGPDDRNRIMLNQVKDILSLWLDEDTFWDIFMLLVAKRMKENWRHYEMSAESSYQIMNFQRLYENAVEWTKPLDQVGDEDDYNLDMTNTEKKLRDKYGMDGKS